MVEQSGLGDVVAAVDAGHQEAVGQGHHQVAVGRHVQRAHLVAAELWQLAVEGQHLAVADDKQRVVAGKEDGPARVGLHGRDDELLAVIVGLLGGPVVLLVAIVWRQTEQAEGAAYPEVAVSVGSGAPGMGNVGREGVGAPCGGVVGGYEVPQS